MAEAFAEHAQAFELEHPALEEREAHRGARKTAVTVASCLALLCVAAVAGSQASMASAASAVATTTRAGEVCCCKRGPCSVKAAEGGDAKYDAEADQCCKYTAGQCQRAIPLTNRYTELAVGEKCEGTTPKEEAEPEPGSELQPDPFDYDNVASVKLLGDAGKCCCKDGPCSEKATAGGYAKFQSGKSLCCKVRADCQKPSVFGKPYSVEAPDLAMCQCDLDLETWCEPLQSCLSTVSEVACEDPKTAVPQEEPLDEPAEEDLLSFASEQGSCGDNANWCEFLQKCISVESNEACPVEKPELPEPGTPCEAAEQWCEPLGQCLPEAGEVSCPETMYT